MKSKKEMWKPAPGPWGERYEVSSWGRVRNLETGRLLKNYVQNNGRDSVRVIVTLNLYCKRKTHVVARLVKEAFSAPLSPVDVIGFRDGDSTNLRYENLYVLRKKAAPSLNIEQLLLDIPRKAQEGVSLEDVAKHYKVAMPVVLRLLGISYWNRLRACYGQQAEEFPKPRLRSKDRQR